MRMNGLHDGLLMAASLTRERPFWFASASAEREVVPGWRQPEWSGFGLRQGVATHPGWWIPVLPNRPEVVSSYREEAAAVAKAALRAAASAACSLKHARTR
jgi:hypothetical protein